jgi:hypothetical protein
MTRNEAIRTIAEVFARANKIHNEEDASPRILVLALAALGVSLEEVIAVGTRALAELEEEGQA